MNVEGIFSHLLPSHTPKRQIDCFDRWYFFREFRFGGELETDNYFGGGEGFSLRFVRKSSSTTPAVEAIEMMRSSRSSAFVLS